MVAYVRAQMLWLYIIRTWDSSAQGFGPAADIARTNADQAFRGVLHAAFRSN